MSSVPSLFLQQETISLACYFNFVRFVTKISVQFRKALAGWNISPNDRDHALLRRLLMRRISLYRLYHILISVGEPHHEAQCPRILHCEKASSNEIVSRTVMFGAAGVRRSPIIFINAVCEEKFMKRASFMFFIAVCAGVCTTLAAQTKK